MRLSGEEFVRRYSMHILPRRFVRNRHFGILSAGARNKLRKLQEELGVEPVPTERTKKGWKQVCEAKGIQMDLCPKCKEGILVVVDLIRPRVRSPETHPQS